MYDISIILTCYYVRSARVSCMQNCAQLILPFGVWVLHSHLCPLLELRQPLPYHFTWLLLFCSHFSCLFFFLPRWTGPLPSLSSFIAPLIILSRGQLGKWVFNEQSWHFCSLSSAIEQLMVLRLRGHCTLTCMSWQDG